MQFGIWHLVHAQFLARNHVHASRQDSRDTHWRATVTKNLLHRHNM